MVQYDFIRQRITALRMKMGVSEFQMSLDLGHSRSYIHNIVSGRSKPAIDELLHLCEYLGVTPKDFFDEDQKEPFLVQKATAGIRDLPEQDLLTLIGLIERLKENHQSTRSYPYQ